MLSIILKCVIGAAIWTALVYIIIKFIGVSD